MDMSYRILNIYTGYMFGHWDNYEQADCYRNTLDDWIDWVVETY